MWTIYVKSQNTNHTPNCHVMAITHVVDTVQFFIAEILVYPHLLSECLGLSFCSAPNSSFLLRWTLGASKWWLKCIGPSDSRVQFELSSYILALKWTSPSYCKRMQIGDLCLSLYVSAFQTNKLKKLKVQKLFVLGIIQSYLLNNETAPSAVHMLVKNATIRLFNKLPTFKNSPISWPPMDCLNHNV